MTHYTIGSLTREQLASNPLKQLQVWIDDAVRAEISDATAMVLATATSEGVPSTRTVLLKKIDKEGFLFFTNYQSRKGEEMFANPFVSCTFYWRELERQIVVDGEVEKVSSEESVDYFKTRPRGSQIGAWASEAQGRVLESRGELEKAFQLLEHEYQGKEVPLPPYWGGFRVVPSRIEFWQGRPNRLHDRFSYRRHDGHWIIERLTP